MIELRSSTAVVLVDESSGGRVASLVVHGEERLVVGSSDNGSTLSWGSYPMAPWAGRVRSGRFDFAGSTHQLPLRLPPHALHGTVLDVPWRITHSARNEVHLTTSLGPDWPWQGTAKQHIELVGDRSGGALRCRLSVESTSTPFPAQVGWHPWFCDHHGEPTAPRLRFAAQAMYQRDASGIPNGDTVLPGPHPWDDCFVGVSDAPTLAYRDGTVLMLSSDCDHWVVYEPDGAVCVEPQSGPPDGFTLRPDIVEPGRPLSRTFVCAWSGATGVVTHR